MKSIKDLRRKYGISPLVSKPRNTSPMGESGHNAMKEKTNEEEDETEVVQMTAAVWDNLAKQMARLLPKKHPEMPEADLEGAVLRNMLINFCPRPLQNDDGAGSDVHFAGASLELDRTSMRASQETNAKTKAGQKSDVDILQPAEETTPTRMKSSLHVNPPAACMSQPAPQVSVGCSTQTVAPTSTHDHVISDGKSAPPSFEQLSTIHVANLTVEEDHAGPASALSCLTLTSAEVRAPPSPAVAILHVTSNPLAPPTLSTTTHPHIPLADPSTDVPPTQPNTEDPIYPTDDQTMDPATKDAAPAPIPKPAHMMAHSFADILRGEVVGATNRDIQGAEKLVFHPDIPKDKLIVDIPEEVQSRPSLWGTVLGSPPPLSFIRTFVSLKWNNLQVEIRVSAPGVFIFEFAKEEELQWVLDSGPWMLGGDRPLMLTKREKGVRFTSRSFEKVPVWVVLPNLHPGLRTNHELSRIGSMIGTPICTDHATATKAKLGYARLLVEMTVPGTLREEIILESATGKTLPSQPVVYEWLPWRCTRCARFGHPEGCCKDERRMEWRIKRDGRLTKEKKSVPKEVVREEPPIKVLGAHMVPVGDKLERQVGETSHQRG